MRVMERLQHGLTAAWLAAALIFATVPNIALGQIVTPTEPYGQPGGQETIQQPAPTTTVAHQQFATIDEAFLRARQAVAVGDVASASVILQRMELAQQQQGQENNPALTSKMGDSVDNIRSLITRQNDLADMANQKVNGYNEEAVSFLLQQATNILKYNDLDTARMLADQAQRFPVDFQSLKVTPDSVLAAINQASQNKTGSVDDYTKTQLAVSEVLSLMSRAELAFDKGNLDLAKSLTDQAKSMGVADTSLPTNQTLPWQLELKIQDAMGSRGATAAVSYEETQNNPRVVQADYDPAKDTTKVVQVAAHAALPGNAANTFPGPTTTTTPPATPENVGMRFYEAGITALRANDLATARQEFEQAWENRSQLDENTLQTVQDQLSNLPFPSDQPGDQSTENSVSPAGEQFPNIQAPPRDAGANELFTDMSDQDQFRKLQSEIFRQRAAAERIRGKNPNGAITLLTELRAKITQSELSDEAKRPLFTMINRDIAEFQEYVDDNLPAIQLEEENAAALADVRESREKRYATEQQIQKLVEEFNDLMDEQRYMEARMVARQAEQLSPDSEIVSLLKSKAQLAINSATAEEIKAEKEENFVHRMNDVDRDSINNVTERDPLVWDDQDRWNRLSKRRADWLTKQQYSSSTERDIWNMLKKEKVQGHYQGTLQDAIGQIREQTGANIIFDQLALSAEEISTSGAVDVPIQNPISLQSALNVILGNSGLVFVVEDEVIKITSRDVQRRDLKRRTYYIGDLVTPIQNFQNSLNMNFLTPNGGSSNGFIGQGRSVPLAGQNSSSISPIALSQQASGNAMGQQLGGLPGGGSPILGGLGGGPVQSGNPTYSSIGPQNLGGVSEADFQPLIRLIRNTIDPDGWDDTNGDGTVQAFVPNLSLIVSQTQEVQDQIQDLLQQLRELNDVQIVVEVRFVSLADDFFERIGVDFDFNLNDNSGINPLAIPEEVNPSSIVGLTAGLNDVTPSFSGDLDIPFQQSFFSSTVPTFGGFDMAQAANFGFAILSDIEVFFLIQASKGDSRTNVTQAPTLTMFNGQVASVSDGSTVPFVTSVTPVVGDFAVAQQPIITLFPDGTSLNVQSVVSNDRKSVRMTLVPFFSQITNVDTFTFDGSVTTQRASDDSLIDDLLGAALGDVDDGDDLTELETTSEGVTIQLPTLGFTTVSTVVSVPDGGTILLGGIKRQREQRIERGVPFLSNIPYVSRLFKNVGIARETSSLMMMVTPRIIIQEEEEIEQTGINSRDR